MGVRSSRRPLDPAVGPKLRRCRRTENAVSVTDDLAMNTDILCVPHDVRREASHPSDAVVFCADEEGTA